MQFKVNVDCTPEEARAFLGLPDLKPVHDHYVQAVVDAMAGQTSVEQMERLFKGLSPLGDAGMKLFSNMMDIGMAGMAAANRKE